MTRRPRSGDFTLLHCITAAGNNSGLSDADLLERFALGRDAAAFELLVWRHRKMVMKVCRRVLGDDHEAEDAFQATFLALACRANRLGANASVGGWLFRVAYRIAVDAGRRRQKRRCQDTRASLVDQRAESCNPEDAAARQELRAMIDAEVDRLPERLRVPIVLCYFAGKSHAEAARDLACPIGTVESRLSRARERLRLRLIRRGLAVPALVITAALTAETGFACGTSLILPCLVRAVAAAGAGNWPAPGSFSPKILSLTRGALKPMTISKLKILGGLVVSLAIVGSTGVGLAYRAAPPEARGSSRSLALFAPGAEKEPAEAWSVESELVTNRGVRAELKLTEKETEKLNKVLEDWTKKYKDEFRETGEKLAKGDGKPWLDLMQRCNLDLGKAVVGTLEPEHLRRLKQIQLRQKDIDAYVEPRLVKALKLSDKQKKTVSEQVAEAHKNMTALIKANVRTPTPEEWRRAKETTYGPAVEKICSALDSEQKKALDELLGEPFEFQREVPDQQAPGR